ncbi:hypothetical protein [Kitasatospora sp. NBC_01266]|uniref:hypothetical protein n=1 Tax=Kitasatospora sp. NBC_01266 TaxID=2903572 RepID=UPI002E2F1FC2|nr:hypothetical protein [Kitasatospora sp. NBC_01266]
MAPEAGPRRFLIATAVAHYRNEPAWNRPGLVEARQDIIRLFTRRFGYRHVSDLGLDPTQGQLVERLRAFCRSPERREDDLITVYLGGHGEVLDEEDGGGHVLLTSDTDPDDIAGALPTEELARQLLSGTRVRRLLLLLDTCYSGQGGAELTSAALERMSPRWGQRPGSGLVVVCSAQPLEQAETGAFPRRLREAAASLATAGHGPRALALDAVVQHMNREGGFQRVGLAQIGLTGEVPEFLPNTRHEPQLTEVDLALQQTLRWQRRADRRGLELTSRFMVRAGGSSSAGELMEYRVPTPDASGWWFSGRRTALADLAEWLGSPASDRPALAVTAGPGSGKTAVLGLLATLAHPEYSRTVPIHALGLERNVPSAARHIDVAIYAQTLTDQQVLEGIAAAARCGAATVGTLLEALTGRERPLVVLVDALDEAATPDSLCATVLRPLIEHARGRIRLLLGTRPHLLARLGLRRESAVDLDAERYADPEAVLTYTVRNLLQGAPDSPYRGGDGELRYEIASAIARAADRSFLVARITAATHAAMPTLPDPYDPAWRAGLPRHAGQAMARDLRLRLGEDAARAVDLLRPLAYAEGQGLPWEDVWAPLASAVSGRRYTDEDVLWLRRTAGSYIVEAVEEDRSAYRLYHQALAEHLRDGVDSVAVHAAFTRVLTDRVPYGSAGEREWGHAHPYTLRYLAAHAVGGGVLDEVLGEAEYLVHADPDGLAPRLRAARSEGARLAAAVYLASLGVHRSLAPHQRRQLLALDATRYNSPALATTLNGRPLRDTWVPLHATGGGLSHTLSNTIVAHAYEASAFACAVLDGRPVAVASSDDGAVQVWDLGTGKPVGAPLTGHNDEVDSVACAELEGVPIAITASRDSTVRIWDLATRQPLGEPLTGHTDWVTAVACTLLNGKPIAITSSADATLRIWDLSTRQPLGEPLTGHTGQVTAVACTLLDGKPIAITGGADATVRIWDLTTRQPLGEALTGHTGQVTAVACTLLNGKPIAATSSNDPALRIWDLTTRQPLGEPLTGHTNRVTAVACTLLDGNPIAITGGADATVRIWDLTTHQPLGEPLTGHNDTIWTVAFSVLSGGPAIVTSSDDSTIRVWDLSTSQPVGAPVTGHQSRVTAVACSDIQEHPVGLSGSTDAMARLWDLTTGQPIGKPLVGHESRVTAAAFSVLDGRPIAVTGSHDATLRIWDLTGQPIGKPLTGHTGRVTAVACTLLNGKPIAVTGSMDMTVRLWDLAARQPLGEPLTGHTNDVNAVACTLLNGKPIAITNSADATLRFWDLATHQPLSEPLTGHTGPVDTVACTLLDDRPIAVTGSDDGTLRFWDLATHQPLGEPLTGHTDWVTSVTCSVLNGRAKVASTGYDGSLRVWDIATRACEAVLTLPYVCTALALTDSGYLVAAFNRDIAIFTRRP